MKYRLINMLALLLLCAAACKTPELDYRKLSNKVRISSPEGSAYAGLSTVLKKQLKKDRYYSWYDKGIIGSTQGGYSGKLLDGRYTSWYATSKQLHEQGNYQDGLKDGLWMSWEPDGKLKESQKWNKGLLIEPKPKRSLKSRLLWLPKKIGKLFKSKKRDSL